MTMTNDYDFFTDLSQSFDALLMMASDTWDGSASSPLASSKRQQANKRRPGTTTTKTTKICFSNRVRVLEIPSAKTLTKRERKALWYPDPHEGQKSRLRLILCGMDDLLKVNGDFDDRHDECNHDEDDIVQRQGFSGRARLDERDDSGEVDYFDELGYNNLIESRRFPVMAVLAEQGNQRQSGNYDVDFLSKIYQQCSRESVMRAHDKARQDENVARQCSGTTDEAIDAVLQYLNRTNESRLNRIQMFRPRQLVANMRESKRSSRDPIHRDNLSTTSPRRAN